MDLVVILIDSIIGVVSVIEEELTCILIRWLAYFDYDVSFHAQTFDNLMNVVANLQ